MALIFVRARTQDAEPSPKATWSLRLSSMFFAIPTLLLPVGMVLGILSGFATPTEVSSVAVAYAFALAFAYRRGNRALFTETLRETTVTAGMVLFIIAAASPLAQTLSVAGVSGQIEALMSKLGDNTFLFMAITIVLLIIMGQLLEGLPAVLIFAPLLLPIALEFGVNPVHYAMVLIIAMGIGSFAPPAGVGSTSPVPRGGRPSRRVSSISGRTSSSSLWDSWCWPRSRGSALCCPACSAWSECHSRTHCTAFQRRKELHMQRRLRPLAVLTTAAAALLSVAACTATPGGGSSTGGSGASTANIASLVQADQKTTIDDVQKSLGDPTAKPDTKLCYVTRTLANEFWASSATASSRRRRSSVRSTRPSP